MEKRASHDRLRDELLGVARDEGLTPAKLESTQLISLVAELPGWSVADTTQVLCKLIADVVSDLRGEKARTAARVTLNLDGSPVHGRSAMGRQAALAAKRHVHPDTVRGWWRNAVRLLVDVLPLKIGELNRDPVLWHAYRTNSAGNGAERVPDYAFDRIDIAWRLRGRLATEMTTYRWLVAHKDGVASVSAKGWYFSDRSPNSCEVVPLLNCTKTGSIHVGPGILLSTLAFPQTLTRGESVFYAYQVVIHSNLETETLFYHSVVSAGVKLLIYRVQFDPAMLPARVWSFAVTEDPDAFIPPPDGSAKSLTTNSLGYTECEFRDCRFGTKYGISWQWPEMSV